MAVAHPEMEHMVPSEDAVAPSEAEIWVRACAMDQSQTMIRSN